MTGPDARCVGYAISGVTKTQTTSGKEPVHEGGTIFGIRCPRRYDCSGRGRAGRRGAVVGIIPNREESVRKLVKKLGPPDQLRVCYEAGPMGYVLHWQLTSLGVKFEVVAPTLVPVKPRDRVKTIRRECPQASAELPLGRFNRGVGAGRGARSLSRSVASTRSGQAGSAARPSWDWVLRPLQHKDCLR